MDTVPLDTQLEMAAMYLVAAFLAAFIGRFCSIAYASVARVRKSYVENNEDQPPELIEKIKPFYQDPARTLAGAQFGGVLAAAFFVLFIGETGDVFRDIMELDGRIETLAEWSFYFVAMFLYWVVAIRIPGDAALVYPLRSLADHAWGLSVLGKCFAPFVSAGLWMIRKYLSWRNIPFTNEVEFTYSEEEIENIVEESHRGGKLSALENFLLKNSFDSFDLMAVDVMIPRSEMTCLYYEDSMEEMRDVIASSHHTRYPVCMDDKDNIIGFVHVKDFFESMASGKRNTKSIMRNILTVPEVMPASKLLQLMRTRRIYFAVVVDEYGTTAGLVTLEDIMEELVGEIQQEKDPEANSVVKHEDGSFEFDGMVILDDVEDLLGISFEEEGGANTIGGYVFGVLERIPKVGDVVDIQGWRFRVLKMDGFRILRLKANRETPPEETAPKEAEA